MGMTTTHGCWDGGCGGFNGFRQIVGRAAGIPYEDGLPDVDWDTVTDNQLLGEWDQHPPTVARSPGYDPPITDTLLYLLIHCDCAGILHRDYLPALKARLEELEPAYARIMARHPDDHYYAHRLRQFIDGLGRAIEAGEHVEFH